jgi:serine protease DegS
LREGPADEAGILPGDVLLRIEGKAVRNARSAMSRIAQSGPGTKLKLEGIRDGQAFRATVVTGHRPER